MGTLTDRAATAGREGGAAGRARPAAPPRTAGGRLVSVDALRGFDMLWIVGGSSVLAALAASPGGALLEWLEAQTHHAAWHGFTLWDLVFPLFLFLAGVSMPLSFARRRAAGEERARLARKVARRGLLLVLLGMVYNGLLAFEWSELRVASVLGRIGLAYLGAGWIVLAWGARGQLVWIVLLLAGYHALLVLVPAPGMEAPSLARGATVVDWIDRALLPGRLHRGDHDPEGLASTLPAVATALLGARTGAWLGRRARYEAAGAGILALAGLALLAGGWLWSFALPINKSLWTSSFVLWTGGLSLLALALFHLLFDVWRLERLAFPLVVIGANAITIYLLHRFVDFQGLAALLLARGEGRLHPALLAAGGLALQWLLLWWMYRRRIFLRV